MTAKSYYVELKSTNGKTLLGGVQFTKSSRFQRRADAENWAEVAKIHNQLACPTATIRESNQAPEVMAMEESEG